MADTPPEQEDEQGEKPFSNRVAQRAERKILARERSKRSAWFGLGMFGLVGWSVAIPTLIGISIGAWLDNRWPGKASWTLTFLIIGVTLGCLNAWYWIKQESERDQNNDGNK